MVSWNSGESGMPALVAAASKASNSAYIWATLRRMAGLVLAPGAAMVIMSSNSRRETTVAQASPLVGVTPPGGGQTPRIVTTGSVSGIERSESFCEFSCCGTLLAPFCVCGSCAEVQGGLSLGGCCWVAACAHRASERIMTFIVNITVHLFSCQYGKSIAKNVPPLA